MSDTEKSNPLRPRERLSGLIVRWSDFGLKGETIASVTVCR